MAEKVGFEPTEHRCSTVFKTASLNHSDTSPQSFTECINHFNIAVPRCQERRAILRKEIGAPHHTDLRGAARRVLRNGRGKGSPKTLLRTGRSWARHTRFARPGGKRISLPAAAGPHRAKPPEGLDLLGK